MVYEFWQPYTKTTTSLHRLVVTVVDYNVKDNSARKQNKEGLVWLITVGLSTTMQF